MIMSLDDGTCHRHKIRNAVSGTDRFCPACVCLLWPPEQIPYNWRPAVAAWRTANPDHSLADDAMYNLEKLHQNYLDTINPCLYGCLTKPNNFGSPKVLSA